MLISHRTTARSTLLALIIGGLLAGPANAAVPNILFPIVGKTTYQNDFGDPRGSHRHQGNDLMAKRGSPVVAVEAGKVRIYRKSASAGCMLYLYGASGTVYYYIHLNDDLTAKDDNRATNCRVGVAYAKGLKNDMRVRAGALIGYVGNSGDARGIYPHLHFELHPKGKGARSPYKRLRKAPHLIYAVPQGTKTVRLGLVGTMRPTTAEDRFGLNLQQVFIANGWRGKPTGRAVTFGLDAELAVERRKAGEWIPTKLEGAKPGEQVSVRTTWFKPTLQTQMPKGGLLTAVRVRLHGQL
jgi:murein DD-endopeptidase MepM/ murein hydrolase activator NlpD